MGWWWSSSPESRPSATASTPSEPTPSTNHPSHDFAPATDPTRRRQDDDKQTDSEVEAFLASLEKNDSTTPSAPTRIISQRIQISPFSRNSGIPAPQETPTHFAPSGTTDPRSPTTVAATGPTPGATDNDDLSTLDISPKALYPRQMSCRQAFDQAFYCQSLGGKFNDLYRYGGVRSCSEQWDQFWFCMRIKGLGDKEKEHAVAEWYGEREERVKRDRGGSSEDVWSLRETPVLKAFWKDPDEITQTWKGEESDKSA